MKYRSWLPSFRQTDQAPEGKAMTVAGPRNPVTVVSLEPPSSLSHLSGAPFLRWPKSPTGSMMLHARATSSWHPMSALHERLTGN
jgi:hypothetical protein